MAKKKRRIWWFHYDEIEEAETWLADMAAKGWHLCGSNGIFVHFTQGKPETVRYRCDIFSRKDGFDERIDLYSQSGWEYVASVSSSLHIFRSPATGTVPEIHSDPVEMAPTLNLLLRPFYLHSLIALVSAVVLLVPPLLYGRPSLWLLIYADYTFALSLLVLVSMFVMVAAGVSRVLRKRAKLQQGLPFSHKKPYQRARITKIGGLLATFLCLTIILLKGFTMSSSYTFKPLPHGELPVVRLSEFVPDTEYVPDPGIPQGYFTSSSILVPWQWFSAEFARQSAESGSAHQSALVFSSYRARTTGLADTLARKLPSKFELRKSESYSGDLWIYRDGNVHEFILLKEKYVFHVFYNGLEPVEKLIGLVEDKIASLNK